MYAIVPFRTNLSALDRHARNGDDHALGRNLRVLQGEGRRCRIVAEQALAVAEQQRVDQQMQFIDQARRQQLLHQIAAALGQQVGAVLLFQRADRCCDVCAQSMAVVPVEGCGVWVATMLGHPVEQVGDGEVFRAVFTFGQ